MKLTNDTRSKGSRTLAKRLKRLKLSQADFARSLDVSRSIVCRWLGGGKRPSYPMALRIQDACGVQAGDWWVK